MSEWKEYKLGTAPLEIIDGDRGTNYPKNHEFSDEGFCLFLSTKNVREDGFLFSDCQFITQDKDQSLRKGKLQRNDIILTTRGTIGNLGFYNDSVKFENIRINSGMVIIRPKSNELLPSYCYYVFRKLQSDYISHVSGSAQPQLPIKDLKEIDVVLPPLQEQEQIAEILSSLDDKIDLLTRQNRTLEAMAETLFRQYFIENPKEGWKYGKLSDICFFRNKKQSIAETTLTQYISTENILSDKMGIVEATSLPTNGNGTAYYLGDILVSNIRPYFKKIWLADKDGISSNDVLCFTSHCNEIHNYYIYYILRQDDFFEYVMLGSKGCKMPRGDKDHIKNYPICIPDSETLYNFHYFIEPNITKIQNNQVQIRSLTKLRDTLLPKLMNNEIKIQEYEYKR